MSIKIKMPQGHFNSWLTIVNELRTDYYDDIINLAPELQKVNNITTNLNVLRNYNTIRI